jgi:high-affinity nickel permease
MNDLSTFSILSLGFVLGMRHAVEADHVVAVSTMVGSNRSFLATTRIGALWGIGHTVSLLVLGCVVILLKVEVSPTADLWLESLVGVMLIALGLNALRNLWKTEVIHTHAHESHDRLHSLFHRLVRHPETSRHRLDSRSVLVGMVHGFAGTAGLMVLIVPVIGSTLVAIGYIVLFGAGSIVGMALMSLVMSVPFHFTAGRFASLNKTFRHLAGMVSVLLGSWLLFSKLFAG